MRLLRAAQFPEDAGPLAHPVRPGQLYRDHQLLHRDGLQQGRRGDPHDATDPWRRGIPQGQRPLFRAARRQAATCEDFVKAMEDASGVDLAQFRLWYSQAGTPKVTARLEHDPRRRTATLHLAQARSADARPAEQAADADPAEDGADRARQRRGRWRGAADPARPADRRDHVSTASTSRRCCRSTAISRRRSCSRPSARPGELERLAEVDPNPFARYEAMPGTDVRALIAAAARRSRPTRRRSIAAMRGTLRSNALDPAFKGEALLLPSEG